MLRNFFAIVLAAAASTTFAQDAKVKPTFLYAQDVKVRGVDEKLFSEKTPKVGVEFFKDTVTNALIAISEAGNLAVVPFASVSDQKKVEWVAAFELRVRDADVASFKDSKKVAMETFKDLGSGKLFIITPQRTLTFADAPSTPPSDKEPTWHHGLILKVRSPGEKDFAAAKQIGVEAFKDETTGGLIYLTDQGFIATALAPTKTPEAEAVKKPIALHGLNLKARKADEGYFTKAKEYGIDVYLDPNSGATLYVCETGSLAAVMLGGEVKKNQTLRWSHSFNLRARKGGEKEFDKAARYGVEVFEDRNTGAMVYICENGSIAVLKK